jgi:hypothetical protein
MHTAGLGPNNAAVHDRGFSAPALFVAGGFLFRGRRVQGAHLATRDTLPVTCSEREYCGDRRSRPAFR